MNAHHHPFFELIVPLRGTLQVRSFTITHTAGPGDILLYPPEVDHEEWTDGKAFESLFVAFSGMEINAGDLVIASDPNGRIRELMRWLYQEQQTLKTGDAEPAHSLLKLILEFFRCSQAPAESEWLRAIRTFIRQYMASTLTLNTLAAEAGMSRFHFTRKYHQLAGRPPMADVRRIRADYARELILSTNMPLKEIAPAAGLANEYTLSRLFRQLFNMPPGEFRRQRRTRQIPLN